MFIEIKNARKYYGEGDALVKAIDDINLSLDEGKVYVILGPSGSGKSTLLNMVGGLDSLDDGEIIISGRNISRADKKSMTEYRREDIGFVFQFYNLIPDLTVQENIEVVADISNNPLNINEVMEELGIASYKNRFPKELSGGQQQRTAIGRAIVKNPDILLCDEPTGALDYNTSKDILRLIETVNQKYGNTIVMVTHNDAIKDMADRVVKLRDGMIRKNYTNEQKVPAMELEW